MLNFFSPAVFNSCFESFLIISPDSCLISAFLSFWKFDSILDLVTNSDLDLGDLVTIGSFGNLSRTSSTTWDTENPFAANSRISLKTFKGVVLPTFKKSSFLVLNGVRPPGS